MTRTKLRATVAALGTVAALALGATPPATADDVRQTADLIMNLRYYDFTNHPKIPPFNWSNDGCSGPQEFKDLFTEACNQHDFGYRNYGHQYGGLNLSPTRETKDWIDTRFWHEMRQTCIDHHGGSNWCLGHAKVAYDAVSRFGDEHFWEAG
ncbi:phospholipase A2 [Streptomyces sp. NPDC057877]|uniref:phospholipase A2 n=1 Tax=Streptomyces sp. NPDC057877 TaxID=3346269 RepID=UPI0036857DB2